MFRHLKFGEMKIRFILRKAVTVVSAAAFCLASSPAVKAGLPPISLAQMYSYASSGNVRALRAAVQRGLYKDAIACFNEAVAIDQTSLEALNGKAIALQHMFSYKEALDVLEQAMKIDNKHTQTLLSIAVTLQKLKQYERAISFFKKVLSGDKTNIKAWNGGGVSYQLMGDNNSALKCFTKILNIDSHEIQAWISIGFVYQKMLKFNDALKCYKKAQMMINNRYHHKLYDGLASCLTKISEFDQAIEIYKHIFQREEGKKKWDAQRSIKFVNKLKRKKAIGMLPDVIPQENAPAGNASSAPASEEA